MKKFFIFFFFCFSLVFSAQAEAKKNPCRNIGKLAKLTNSEARQKRQNCAAKKYKLSRLKNLAQLKKFIKKKWLVLVSDTDAYYLDSKEIGKWAKKKNKKLYHHARASVKNFLDTELTKCYKETGGVFKINSLVRTFEYQKLVRKYEGGAIMGKKWWQKSLHLTGSAVDISYEGGATKEGKDCLRKRLRELDKENKVITIYEKDHFHIFVSQEY